MFRPQIQKTRVLVFMAFFSLMMVYIASNSIVTHTSEGFEEKKLASEIMELGLKVLKKEVKARRLGQNDFIPWKRGISL